jgi:RNA polymerase sigma-70 factor (ECF subfamily)
VEQEAFLQAWRQADRYDPSRGTPQAWLSAIVRTRALDRVRRRAARRERAHQAPPVTAGAPNPDAILAVRRALRALSPAQRRAIELAYYQDLSQSEIAARLGEPLGTVKTRIRAAMMRLREELER